MSEKLYKKEHTNKQNGNNNTLGSKRKYRL